MRDAHPTRLVGTLIPTLLHVFSLCLALLLRLVPGFLRRWMLAKLEAPVPRMEELTWLALLRMLAWPVSALAVFLLVGLLLDAVAYAAAPTSELLYGLALHQCPLSRPWQLRLS